MAVAGSLLVEIGADISKLRAGAEHSAQEIAKLRGSFEGHASAMKVFHEKTITNIRFMWANVSMFVHDAMAVINKAVDLARISAEFEEQSGILDNLARKYQTTATEIVSAMETASSGLIAKSDLMQDALSGIAKGLTPDQLINLAKAADTFGDAVGKNATVALQELLEAIETGRTRSLKGFLGQTLDLKAAFGDLAGVMTDAQKSQAMYLLTMENYTKIQRQQTTEVSSAADTLESLDAKYKNVTLSLGNFTKSIIVGTYELGKWLVANQEVEMELALAGKTGGYGKSNIATIGMGKSIAETTELQKQQVEYEKRIASLKEILEIQKAQTAEAKKSHIEKMELTENDVKMQYDLIDLDQIFIDNLQTKIDKANELADQYEYLARTYQDLQTKTALGITEGTPIAAPAAGIMAGVEGKDEYSLAMQSTKDYYDARVAYAQDALDAEGLSNKEASAYRSMIDKAGQDKTLALNKLHFQKRVTMASQSFGMMAGLAQMYYEASDRQSKAAFLIWKAMAISQAILSTMVAVDAAYAWGWEVGGPYAPAVAAAAAAVAMAAGMATVAQIASTSFGGGGGGGTTAGGSVPSIGGGGTIEKAGEIAGRNTIEVQRIPNVEINIYGNVVDQDAFARSLVPAIQKAIADGVR